MPHMTESTFLSADGRTQLYCREYLPDTESVGIVQLVHGIAEHIGRYDAFATFLADNGFIVVCHDHLGHGKSITEEVPAGFFHGEKGWEYALRDIRTLHDRTVARFPGKPYFLFGHSMGSFLARNYLIRFRTGLDGAIISGTGQQNGAAIAACRALSAMESRREGPAHPSVRINRLAFGSYTKKLGKVRTSNDWLSRDPAVVDAYNADPLCGFVPSASLFGDMMTGLSIIGNPKNLKRMKKDLPVLFISGDCDPVGENGRGVVRVYNSFLRSGMADVTIKLYPGGRHEMLNEINHDEVYADILTWLNSKIGR